jgi:restriction system protein
MKKSDTNYFSNTFGIIVAFLILIYPTKIKEAFPFLENIYLLIGFAVFVGIFTSVLLGYLLPNSKKKKTAKKNNSTEKRKKTTSSKKKRMTDLDLLKADIFTLEGTDFEELCYMYFADNGYNPERTKATGDHGVDLVIKDPNDGMKIAVQCKRWKNTVGNNELIKLYSGKNAYKCIGTLFITTSTYSKAAKEYSELVRMRTWNGAIVQDKIGKWQKEKLKKIS